MKCIYNSFYWYYADNSDDCYRILLEALQELLHKTESNEFSTIIQGQMYHIQPSSAHVKTNVKCPPGTVASDMFCGKIINL